MPEKKEKRQAITGTQLTPEPDFFHVDNKNPDYHYYLERDRRIDVEKTKRLGYEVVNSTTSNNEERALAGDNRIDSTTGIPGHILMYCSKEHWEKRKAEKQRMDEENRRMIEKRVKDVSKALERGGVNLREVVKELKNL